MKEITRIHIAKISYDIELAAKKDLESYIKKLELYSDDTDLLDDIEIRMTEILSDRSIEKNGLITLDDVMVIKEQLGEPQEFLGEGDMAVGPSEVDAIIDRPRRRLYRDIDNAVLGGVLSGLAKYIDINPVWTRIAFLVILFMSFGVAAIVYIVLWAIIPAARTAAEKLESAGHPITLASIKSLNERASDAGNRIAPVLQSMIRYGSVIALSVLSLGTVVFTGIVGYHVFNDNWWVAPGSGVVAIPSAWTSDLAYGLMMAAGLLLATLFAILAVALAKKSWTKRLTVVTVAVIASGLLTFGGGFTIVTLGALQQNAIVENSRTTVKGQLPETFRTVKSLVSDGSIKDKNGTYTMASVIYIVDTGTPRYEVTSSSDSLTPVITIDGTEAKLSTKSKGDVALYYMFSTITIYGPALEKIVIDSAGFDYINNGTQATLTVETNGRYESSNTSKAPGTFTLRGSYEAVNATVHDGTFLSLNQASIQQLTSTVDEGYINAGVVRTLTATIPDVCASDGEEKLNRVVVRAVSSQNMRYNGTDRQAATISNDCAELIVGDEQEFDMNKSDD